ncbi:MAG: tetratricopeptide repeat protein [Acidobacteria bacterium]|nr:tetratricopeptide repeat protein [Acidobacteriota bacterium]
MKVLTDQSDNLDRIDFTASSLSELVFDDEPLEHILYGKGGKGPTPAGLFRKSREYMDGIHEAYAKGDIQTVIDASRQLMSDDCTISMGVCFRIAGLMKKIVPHIPNPVMPFDLTPLQPLLEKIWQIAAENGDAALQKTAGSSLYQWYQHHRHYEKARIILRELIEIHIRDGDRSEEAVMRNNYAFEYFLEGRFQEAIPEFEKAAMIFEETGETGQCANSRSNSWMCRFESGDLPETERVEAELRRLAEILEHRKYWQARKPLILLARIAERHSRIKEAISLVRQAMEACRHANTRYPEMDGEYLAYLIALQTDAGPVTE